MTPCLPALRKWGGFTLIEIAISLAIITLVIGAGISILLARTQNAAIQATRTTQTTIRDALTTYLGRFGRLPCPDTDLPPDGAENRDGGSPSRCVSLFGSLPWATLNLPREAALDGWSNYIGYGVSPRWTLTYSTSPQAGQPQTSTAAEAFFVGIGGTLVLNDRIPPSNSLLTPLVVGAPVVLVSYGANRLGAINFSGLRNVLPDPGTDERTNVNETGSGTAFFGRQISDVETPTYGAFDDVVRAITADEITSALARDGALVSSSSSLNQSFTSMTDAVIGAAVTSHLGPGTPYSLPASLPVTLDPWGNPIVYAPAGALVSPGITAITSAPVTAFTLTSGGPTPAMGDDIVYSVSLLQLKGIFAKTGF